MKCPHCKNPIALSSLRKSFFRPQRCPACEQSYVLSLSVGRGLLLLLPVALTLFMIRPLSIHWGIAPVFLTAPVIFLYLLSCLRIAQRSTPES